MSPEIVSLVLLVAMFLIASFLPIHLGALAFAFTYGLSLAFGITSDEIFGGFPGELFVLLVGVTYLFALAQANGTIDWIVDRGVALVGGRIALIPWLMFGLTVLIVSLGALNAAGLACIAPIAMKSARHHSINQFMMALMLGLGSYGGGFSPISPLGIIVNGALSDNDLPTSPGWLFVLNLGFATAVAIGVYLAFGGLRLLGARPEAPTSEPAQTTDPTPTPGTPTASTPAVAAPVLTKNEEPQQSDIIAKPIAANREQLLTIGGILILMVGILGFGMDVGLLAFLIAAPVSLLATKNIPQQQILQRIPWGVVLLIAGVLTYVGVLEQLGTLDYVGDLANSGAAPLVALLIVCYVGAFISAFAATSGVLVATIPFLIPLLQTNEGISVLGAVAAMTLASTIVDLSPMSTNGAVLLASAEGVDERLFFRRLLTWAVATVLAAPALAWLAFIVIPTL